MFSIWSAFQQQWETGKASWSDIIRQRDFGKIADWFCVRFLFVGCAGIATIGASAFYQIGVSGGLRVVAFAILMAGACATIGWVFGLIFGIPRSLARPQPNAGTQTPNPAMPDGASGQSRVNTNLEDISDWLTKTIVGVGLTQLKSIPKFLGDLAAAADQYGFGWNPYGHLLAFLLMVFCTPGGFWLGYVGTRTILTKLFDWADSGLGTKDIDTAASPSNLQPSESGIRAVDPKLAAIDSILLKTPLEKLTSPEEVLAWSAAHARSGDLQTAKVVLENMIRSNPGSGPVRQQLGTVYTLLGQHDKAAALLSNATGTPTVVLNALYEDPPGGFTKAISVGEQLLAAKNYKDDLSLHVWLACAYGQQYKYQIAAKSSDQVLSQTRSNVIREIKAAIDVSASARGWLLTYWKPAPGSNEDDLSAFPANDPDLTALLEMGTQSAVGSG